MKGRDVSHKLEQIIPGGGFKAVYATKSGGVQTSELPAFGLMTVTEKDGRGEEHYRVLIGLGPECDYGDGDIMCEYPSAPENFLGYCGPNEDATKVYGEEAVKLVADLAAKDPHVWGPGAAPLETVSPVETERIKATRRQIVEDLAEIRGRRYTVSGALLLDAVQAIWHMPWEKGDPIPPEAVALYAACGIEITPERATNMGPPAGSSKAPEAEQTCQ